ncbi:MAG: phosphate ABC transporter ATP-binding protein PstB [Gammaproteobacteria bacterium]
MPQANDQASIPAIQIKNLNFNYDKELTLKDINLDIPDKKITAIIGPSGSGKSTLLRTLNRIFDLHAKQKASGEVLLGNENILASTCNVNKLRTRIGMVFQKPTTFPMSIFRNIAFALKIHQKISRAALTKQVINALKQVALWDEVKDKLHQPADALSGGQQQRLCIARTLAIQPEIILLDEPTSSLDPISSQKIEKLLLQLSQRYTLVIVTHNLSQAQRIADHVIFMQQGEIIEHGTTEQLFKQPQRKETLDYVRYHDA